MSVLPFEEFMQALGPLGGTVAIADEQRREIGDAARALQAAPVISRESLAAFVREVPARVPVLALCAGVTQEQLKNLLRHRFGTPGWRALASGRAEELVQLLDERFDLVARIERERTKRWTFGDVLVERFSSRLRARGSIARGRSLEDRVERIVDELGFPRQMRTEFVGRGGARAPCDLAIPAGGSAAQIVCAVKGFDATGSKLTDARREIEEMAQKRLPSQFVFAVVDGIGWLSRRADLQRIHKLWAERPIDGVFTVARLDALREELRRAAARLGLSSDRPG